MEVDNAVVVLDDNINGVFDECYRVIEFLFPFLRDPKLAIECAAERVIISSLKLLKVDATPSFPSVAIVMKVAPSKDLFTHVKIDNTALNANPNSSSCKATTAQFPLPSQVSTMCSVRSRTNHHQARSTEVSRMFNYVIIFKGDVLVAHWGG